MDEKRKIIKKSWKVIKMVTKFEKTCKLMGKCVIS